MVLVIYRMGLENKFTFSLKITPSTELESQELTATQDENELCNGRLAQLVLVLHFSSVGTLKLFE